MRWRTYFQTNQNPEFILNVKKVQTDKFYNSNFSCGNLLAISCLNGSFYLVQKLKLDILQRIDYSQMIKSENSVSFFSLIKLRKMFCSDAQDLMIF